jgi:hypothetical protein
MDNLPASISDEPTDLILAFGDEAPFDDTPEKAVLKPHPLV